MQEPWIFFGLVGLVVMAVLLWQMRSLPMWVTARRHGVRVGYFSVLTMRLRKVDPAMVLVNACVLARAGVPVTVGQLEAHYLCQGNLGVVTSALVAAHLGGLPDVGWHEVCAWDLAGHDVRLEVARRLKAREEGRELPPPEIPAPAAEDGGPRGERTPDA